MHTANDAKTFLKRFSDCLFYFCSTCADSIKLVNVLGAVQDRGVHTSFDGAWRTEASFETHGVLAERRLMGRLRVDVEARQSTTRWSTCRTTRTELTMLLTHHRCTCSIGVVIN